MPALIKKAVIIIAVFGCFRAHASQDGCHWLAITSGQVVVGTALCAGSAFMIAKWLYKGCDFPLISFAFFVSRLGGQFFLQEASLQEDLSEILPFLADDHLNQLIGALRAHAARQQCGRVVELRLEPREVLAILRDDGQTYYTEEQVRQVLRVFCALQV